MKVGLLYPTVGALCEKMAALFPGLTVIGPPCDDLYKWDSRILPLAKAIARQDEWRDLGLDIHFEEKPYSQCDFSKFDLLIESVETFNYAQDWKNHCERVECPIVVKGCWTDGPWHFPQNYIDRIRKFPVMVEMPAHFDAWSGTFPDATCIPNPVGDWWFEKQWTGENEAALFVLAGKDLWRPADKTVCGVDWFEKLSERFPGQMHHHDGAMEFKTGREMTELFSKYRVFMNLDREGARPLATSFTEALAAGMPVVARDHPSLSYGKYIDGNGICTDDFDKMSLFLAQCLTHSDYAEQCSRRSREIALEHFSVEKIRPIYEAAAERARALFQSGAWR
jgi:glycosyltransferase involved in cell wall biosynthesis